MVQSNLVEGTTDHIFVRYPPDNGMGTVPQPSVFASLSGVMGEWAYKIHVYDEHGFYGDTDTYFHGFAPTREAALAIADQIIQTIFAKEGEA